MRRRGGNFSIYVDRELWKTSGSGGIRTHASEETGALNQRLRPLGHATLPGNVAALSSLPTQRPTYYISLPVFPSLYPLMPA